MRKRVFVVGIDALNPKLLLKLVNEGELPHFRKLIEMGGFSKALSALPAQTPENWTTIATGAWPGTHGIATWGRRLSNVPVTEYFGDESMSSNLCRAEYLWEALGRRGLKSVLLNFVGYPPTTNKAVHVDWFWRPGSYYFEISGAACYASKETLRGLAKNGVPVRRLIEQGLVIPVRPVEKAESSPIRSKSNCSTLGFKITVRPARRGPEIVYDGLLRGEEGKGYDMLVIYRDNDPSRAVCTLRVGEWVWFCEEFDVKGRKTVGTVRLKLAELSSDGSKLKLYRSQIYPAGDFVHPLQTGRILVDRFGPYVNEAVEKFFSVLDQETVSEELSYQIKWIANAARHLMERGCSLYMMHWHLIDSVQHASLGRIDPAGGVYDDLKAQESWRVIKLCYRLADMLVGEFMRMLDENTYMIVVSDHGNVPNKKRYPLLKALANAGLVAVEKDKDGQPRVDWGRSKIHISTTNIWVNLKGRYRNGVVEDSEYDKVRDQVLSLLRDLKDVDGKHVISIALKKEDAPMIGLWGEPVGDIVYMYSAGFTWSHNRYEDSVMPDGGANHGPQIPTAETDLNSNYAVFFATGPDMKKGYIRPLELLGPVYTADVAPTVSFLLGVDPPRHSQGRVLHDFLEGWDSTEARREREPLDFPEKPVPFVGDVTEYLLA